MKIIVSSLKDLASITIKNQLIKNYPFEKRDEYLKNECYSYKDILLITIDHELIFAEYIENAFKADMYIMASCHKSESNRPSLLVHTPGNWGEENLYGGAPYSLGVSNSDFIKKALIELDREKNEKNLLYDVSLEVTHHGPTTMNTPITFIELGSTKKEWNDEMGAHSVAISIMNALRDTTTYESVVGIGGTHYAPQFNKLVRTTEYSISHIIPKHALYDLTIDMFRAAFTRSMNTAKFAALDWKGLTSNQRKMIIKYCDKLKIAYKKVKDILH